MELLAPAGNEQALLAAIGAGADAVYLAYTAFGARAGAGNFTKEELAKAVSLCHLWHIKVYVTVNTLIKEKEIEDLKEVIDILHTIKVDGIIVQDIGVASYIQKNYPFLPLHASTQMAIHNVQGALFLKDAGFSRVVLARENSIQTIQEVTKTGIETEVFVHGALCVSQSGQCIFSGMVGGRSGNRGRCAQACRLPYQYDGQWGNWLSPRDMNMRDYLDELAMAGVTSLKIEGRLKRPEYVSEIVASYRKGIDSLAAGEFAKAGSEEKNRVAQVFNRGGFTKGYAFGAQDSDIIDIARVNHGGLPLGKVTRVEKNFAFVLLEEDLNPEDVLRFIDKDESETIYSGPKMEKGSQAKVRLRVDMNVRAGTMVMRLSNAQYVQTALSRVHPSIPVTAKLEAVVDEKSRLILSDGTNQGISWGDIVQAAQNTPLTEDGVFQSLSKLKETPYILTDAQLFGENAFMPLSKLNQLRNDAVFALNKERISGFEKKNSYKSEASFSLKTGRKQSFQKPLTIVKSSNLELGDSFLNQGADLFIFAPRDFRSEKLDEQLSRLPKGAWLALPTQLTGEGLREIAQKTQGYKHLLGGVALGNIGQLGQPFPVEIALLDTVPIWNRIAFETLQLYGSNWEVAWPELNQKETAQLETSGRLLVHRVYGHTRLMTLNHCPARTKLRLKTGREKCKLCMTGAKEALQGKNLTDRKGYVFPLIPTHHNSGCVIELLNSVPTNLFDQMETFYHNHSILVDFTVEQPQTQLEIFLAFMKKRKGEDAVNPVSLSTQGHFYRGVE